MPVVAAYGIYGCSPWHLRLQAERHTLTDVLSRSHREISITFETATTDALWPPRSSGFAVGNIGENLEYVRTNMYWYYVRVLLVNDVRAPLLLLLLGGSFLFGVWTLVRRRSVLLALPAALLVNLGRTLAVDPRRSRCRWYPAIGPPAPWKPKTTG